MVERGMENGEWMKELERRDRERQREER